MGMRQNSAPRQAAVHRDRVRRVEAEETLRTRPAYKHSIHWHDAHPTHDTRTMQVMKLPRLPFEARRPARPGVRTLLVLPIVLALAACATPRAVPVHHPAPVAVNQPLYFYPMRGQDERTQQRDRFECYRWASEQTRSDPGMTPLRHVGAPPPAVYYDPEPGRDMALGAATGAIIGAMTASSPYHSGEAALVGLVLGALIGAVSDQARADNAQRANAQAAAAHTASTRTHGDFRRAMAACMSGRGYAVR